jgi:hypothetical protein
VKEIVPEMILQKYEEEKKNECKEEATISKQKIVHHIKSYRETIQ